MNRPARTLFFDIFPWRERVKQPTMKDIYLIFFANTFRAHRQQFE